MNVQTKVTKFSGKTEISVLVLVLVLVSVCKNPCYVPGSMWSMLVRIWHCTVGSYW